MAEHNTSPKKRRLDIDRVHINLSQEKLQRYILEIVKEPVVFLDKINAWKSLAWTPESLAKQLSNVRTRFRFCPRTSSSEYRFPAKHAVMETDCKFIDGTFEDFHEWLICDSLNDKNSQNSAFASFPRKGKITKYEIQLTFVLCTNAIAAVICASGSSGHVWAMLGVFVSSSYSTGNNYVLKFFC